VTSTPWTFDDHYTARIEGWKLTLRVEPGWQIEAQRFKKWSNEEATLYVAAHAAEGSDLHKRAWALVTGSYEK